MTERSTKNADSTPRGREDVTAALIAAAEHLCEREPPSEISVRAIAGEAAVTTALVYHYFESKDDLIRQTLRSLAGEIDGRAARMSSATEMVREVTTFLAERPAFARIIAWMVLQRRDVTAEMGDHPFLRRLMMALGAAGDRRAQTQAGVVAVFLLGIGLYRPAINRALDRNPDDPELEQALADAAERLVDT